MKVWAHVRKEELIPVHELRNKLKQVLDNLERKKKYTSEKKTGFIRSFSWKWHSGLN